MLSATEAIGSSFGRVILFTLFVFLLLIFSHNTYATAFTISTAQTSFNSGTNDLSCTNPDTLTITSTGSLQSSTTSSVAFVPGGSGTAILNNQSTTSPFLSVGLQVATIGSNSGAVNASIINSGTINAYATTNAEAVDFSKTTSSSSVTMTNSGTINGIVGLSPGSAAINYTHSGTHSYATPGSGNTSNLLDGNNFQNSANSNATLTISGGSINGAISGWNTINVIGDFSTYSGTDPTGITNFTNLNVVTPNTTFTMNSDITATNIGGALIGESTGNSVIFNFNSGTFTGNLNFEGATLNFNGGVVAPGYAFQRLNGSNTVNFNTSINFQAGGFENIQNVNVNNSGTSVSFSQGGAQTNIFTVNSGTSINFITGTNVGINILIVNGTSTFSGGTVNADVTSVGGAGILNVSGGALSGSISGSSGSTININTTYSTVGSYSNVSNINVTSGIFSINNAISGNTSFIIQDGTTTNFGAFGTLTQVLTGATTGTITFQGSGVLDLSQHNTNQTIGDLASSSATSSVTLGSATLTTGSSNNTPVTSTFAGVISGTGGLTKTGTSTLQVSNTNIFSGATSVTGGYLLTNTATPFSNTSGLSVSSGAFFWFLWFSGIYLRLAVYNRDGRFVDAKYRYCHIINHS